MHKQELFKFANTKHFFFMPNNFGETNYPHATMHSAHQYRENFEMKKNVNNPHATPLHEIPKRFPTWGELCDEKINK